MHLEITSSVFYECPHCQAALEARPGRWNGWRLCPSCGRPGLPPNPAPVVAVKAPSASGVKQAEAWIAAGGVDEARPSVAARVPRSTPRSSPTSSTARVVVMTGLIVSMFLALIAYLDHNPRNAGVFGLASFVFFWLLVRISKRY